MFKRILAILIFLLSLSARSYGQDVRITISVIVAPAAMKGGTICVAGNLPGLGDWNPAAAPMTRENDSTWSITVTVPPAYKLEWKITRGSWETEAVSVDGVVPSNMRLKVTRDTIVVMRPMAWKDEYPSTSGGITGTVKYHRRLAGKGLLSPRDIIVWLPPSYGKEQMRRYPVLYMHDGQNIIDPSTSFTQFDWRVDEIADSLIRAGAIEEPIIVGIYNTERRRSEYADTPEGRAYAAFVIDSLKPLIDKTYRTRTDAGSTAVMGSSSGGLISFLFAWWHPEVFSMAGCLSSAFLVDSSKILKDVQSYSGRKKNIRVYLDVGGIGVDTILKPGYDRMIALFEAKGYRKGIDLDFTYAPHAEHNERAWSQRIWKPLLFFFGSRN